MKVKIFKVFAFIIILFFILIILSHIVVPKNNLEEFGMREVKAHGLLAEPENTIDVLIVGNSLSFTSIVPIEIWKEYGFTSYINGTPAQILPDSIRFTYNAMKTQNPKIVILEVDNLFEGGGVAGMVQQIAFQCLPILEYHDRWKSLNANDFFGKIDYTWTEDLKGYYYTQDIISCSDATPIKPTREKAHISKTNKLYLKLLNKYCTQNNAELILVSTPNIKNWNYKKHNATKSFAEELGIDFLDFNVINDTVQIDWEKDTRDNGYHLNHFGAVKVSKHLGKYLSEKNILEDHRNDKKYAEWNTALERYLNGNVRTPEKTK